MLDCIRSYIGNWTGTGPGRKQREETMFSFCWKYDFFTSLYNAAGESLKILSVSIGRRAVLRYEWYFFRNFFFNHRLDNDATSLDQATSQKIEFGANDMLNFDVVVNHVSVTYDAGVNMLLVLTRNYSIKIGKQKKKKFDTSYYIFWGIWKIFVLIYSPSVSRRLFTAGHRKQVTVMATRFVVNFSIADYIIKET